MLKVDNISLYYGAAQALRGVSISAEPGKVTCVLGRNGVGKTSLLRAMVGQYPISGGAIVFDGADSIGMSGNLEARTLEGRVSKGLTQYIQRDDSVIGQFRGVELEIDHEIDRGWCVHSISAFDRNPLVGR